MEIYFSPALLKEETQLLNIVDQKHKPVGYVSFIFDTKKMYVHGQLEEEAVGEDFKDLIKPYIEGVSKAKPDLEVYSYLSIGGKKLELDFGKEKEK